MIAAAGFGLLAGCASSTSSVPSVNQIGDSVPFTNGSGQASAVSVTGIVDPATGEIPAPAGDRYVAVEMSVSNESRANLFADPGGITTVVDDAGSSYSPDFMPLTDCAGFSANGLGAIAPNAKESGCLTFALPVGTRLARVVVGSPGKNPGVWNVQ